ncbi:hypothetical protein PG990_005907 [Apiospora arundinis]|uniref:Integral membrane protein n=1 Tax=Apiospora arundinis TaxID=335852 RepID=A0ABR2J9C2_9PEZI
MSTFLGLLGHRLAILPPALAANCTSLALGLSSSSRDQKAAAAAVNPHHTHNRGRPSSILGTMLFAGTFGLAAMSLFQLLSMRALLSLLFGGPEPAEAYVREFLRSAGGRAHLDATLSAPEAAARAAMARDWRYCGLFCPFFGVVAAGLPEEVLKYLPAATVRWWRARKAARTAALKEEKKTDDGKEKEEEGKTEVVMSPLEFVNYTVAAGIGFAIFENLGVIWAGVEGGSSVPELVWLLAERTFSALPGHVLCAALSGIADSSIRRRRRRAAAAKAGKNSGVGGLLGGGVVNMLSAILPSVLYHGVFDSALLGVSALDGHPGWVRPASPWVLAGTYGLVLAMQGALFLNVRAAWREEARALVEEKVE